MSKKYIKTSETFTATAGAKSAFTLAEVLITLAIIGVVAAMTIPTLMTSTRGKEFETGANKALSTLSNSLQMRYAMDGVTLADYVCRNCAGGKGPNIKIAEYLTKLPPNARAGEQPALQVAQDGEREKISNTVDAGVPSWYSGLLPMPSARLKDGMIMTLVVYNAGIPNHSVPARRFHYVVFDTNGEKGPSRLNVDTSYSGNVGTFNDTTLSFKMDNTKAGKQIPSDGGYIAEDMNTNPTNNLNPDIVVFKVDPYTHSVIPVGRRTRNILATGNAMISK